MKRWKPVLLSLGLLLLLLLASCSSQEPAPREGLPENQNDSEGISPGNLTVPGGNPQEGWALIQEYGCITCHTIPGVPGANALVGPPLNGWAERQYISGRLPNNPENLVRWIMDPQAIEPGTAMVDMGVTEADARDIGAYLYTLEQEND